MTKIPNVPEFHELRDFTVVLPDGWIAEGENPEKRFPDKKPQRWNISIKAPRTIFPELQARLEDVVSPQDLWKRILALRNALERQKK